MCKMLKYSSVGECESVGGACGREERRDSINGIEIMKSVMSVDRNN